MKSFPLFAALFLSLAFAAHAEAPAQKFVRADDEKALTETQLLGKRLFEDANLSEPRGMACQSCHTPERAFQGNNNSPVPAVALGAKPDLIGTRKVPTIMYKTYSPPFGFYKDEDDGQNKLKAKGGQFWDGRANDLVEQAAGPFVNPVEMNNPSLDAVVAKVRDGDYADLAKAVYGPDVFADSKAAAAKITQAIFAYETTPRFAPFTSKFDDYLRGKAQLTEQEALGLKIFSDKKKSNCIDCHAAKAESKDPTDWIFSDFGFEALGVPRNKAIPANSDAARFDLGLCQAPGIEKKLVKGIKRESLCGMFRTPTLRNVAVTGPYFHNGAITSLRDAVAIYATRDTDPGRWFPKAANGKVEKFDDLPKQYRRNVNTDEVPYNRKPGQKPHLDDREIDAIVAFLKTLTDQGMK